MYPAQGDAYLSLEMEDSTVRKHSSTDILFCDATPNLHIVSKDSLNYWTNSSLVQSIMESGTPGQRFSTGVVKLLLVDKA